MSSARITFETILSLMWKIALCKAGLIRDMRFPSDNNPIPRVERNVNVRRLTDIVLAVILAGISLPLMVLGVLAVLSCGRSPFLFQERIGFLGRPFLLFKIRTLDGPYGIQNRGVLDRAFIFLSIVLRRTKIDELPQLLNVIRGEMTLIGPRPLLADDLQSMPLTRYE